MGACAMSWQRCRKLLQRPSYFPLEEQADPRGFVHDIAVAILHSAKSIALPAFCVSISTEEMLRAKSAAFVTFFAVNLSNSMVSGIGLTQTGIPKLPGGGRQGGTKVVQSVGKRDRRRHTDRDVCRAEKSN